MTPRTILALFGTLIISACVVPIQMTIYEPSCVDGMAILCARHDDKLQINLSEDVKISIEGKKHGEKISLCVYLLLEPRSTFEFLSSSFVIENDTLIEKRQVRFSVKGTPQHQKTQIWIWLESAHGTLCETNIPAFETFTLRMPDANVNGNRLSISPIRLIAKRKWEFQGLCC